MRFLPKLLIFTFFLSSVLFAYFYYFNQEPNISEVLQSSTASEFKNFSVALINQYPKISYNDGFPDTMNSRFEVIRRYSSPSKFTHHLCNAIQENSSTWRAGNTCTSYTNQNPKFVKLNFNEGPKLVLFTYYGLFSINEDTNSVNWQSSHVDRFLDNNFAKCNFKFDPVTVIPVKSSGKYYLFSTISGLNTASCLQFYNHETAKKSPSSASSRLVIGYEFNSNGELNRNYSRIGDSYEQILGIPFGPGPKNATSYAFNPKEEVIGCGKYDKNNNCTQAKGVIKNTNTTSSNGNVKYGKCIKERKTDVEAWVSCAFCTTEGCDGSSKDSARSPWDPGYWSCTSHTVFVCASQSGVMPECGTNKNPGTTKVVTDGTSYRNSYRMSLKTERREPSLDYTKKECIERENLGIENAYFSASMSYPIFSKFTDFSLNRKDWNITNSGAVPPDYIQYQNELDRDFNVAAPINFTSKLNRDVFTTNNFMFKVNLSKTNIVIDRYKLTDDLYNLGGRSYIQATSKVSKTVGKSSYSYFSLDFLGNDVYVMASGNNGFVFYKIKNFNNSTSNLKVLNLTSELSKKIPTSYGRPKSFGIIGNKIYIVTSNTVLHSEFSITEPPEIPEDLSQYKNFEFNGNVFSKQNLDSGFMFTNLPEKYQGLFITPNNLNSNLKFFNNSNLNFYYPENTYTSLNNFTNFTGQNFNKFNFLHKNTEAESIPLLNSQYIELNPNSRNNFEIISISKGAGIKINLTNENINKNFDKYILINLDQSNKSRIIFNIDCNDSRFSLVCGGKRFNFKGSLLGQFYIQGRINPAMSSSRFIRIHENADNILNLFQELRKKKYPTVTSNIIFTRLD